MNNGVKSECVVTDEGNGIIEIKNIATAPDYQGNGYAKATRIKSLSLSFYHILFPISYASSIALVFLTLPIS